MARRFGSAMISKAVCTLFIYLCVYIRVKVCYEHQYLKEPGARRGSCDGVASSGEMKARSASEVASGAVKLQVLQACLADWLACMGDGG